MEKSRGRPFYAGSELNFYTICVLTENTDECYINT